MRITRLDIGAVRSITEARLEPAAGVNLLVGENGAGKTSVLEAIHLLGYGRSFRGRVRDGLVRQGQEALEIFVEWDEQRADHPPHRRKAGLRHSGPDWKGRLDGEDVAQLGNLCAALAVVTFEPGSHALVSGGGEPRRRFLDWGLFHVEHDFLALSRRYSRALRQRNALLKSGASAAMLEVWDRELAEAGEPLTRRRQAYVERLQGRAVALADVLAPSLGLRQIEFAPGWRRHEMSLADALLLGRERDRMTGHTGVGPHRADWSLLLAGLPGREALSRGQTKLTALSLLLAQAADYATRRGHWPIIALDDLPSELDRDHQRRTLDFLLAQPGLQLFITATETPSALQERALEYRLFHVEQGEIAG